MLQKNKMVKAVASLYDGICTITEYQKVKNENKSTGFKEVVVLKNEPCIMSHKSKTPSFQTGTASGVSQSITVFMAPDIVVKPGSKITITQNGVTTIYKNSGKPSVYASHQEIPLELFDGWS